MLINTLMYIYIYFYHMLHRSSVTGNTGMYRQNWNNGIDTDSHTGNVHSNSCSTWGDKYTHKFLEVWMFLSCFNLPCKYQVPQNLSLKDGYFLHFSVELGSCAHFTTKLVISSFTLSIHIPLASILSPSTNHSNCCFCSLEVTPFYCLILQQVGYFCRQRHHYCQALGSRDIAFLGWAGHPGKWPRFDM